MNIRIKGKTDVLTQTELKEATKYMASLLMSNRLLRNIDITIKICHLEDLKADVEWLDENNRPKKFLIRISDSIRSRRSFIMSLGHELVHIKQMARNELKYCLDPGLTIKWMGKPVNETSTHYHDLPYEVEAHGRELGLWYRWLDHEKEQKKVRKHGKKRPHRNQSL